MQSGRGDTSQGKKGKSRDRCVWKRECIAFPESEEWKTKFMRTVSHGEWDETLILINSFRGLIYEPKKGWYLLIFTLSHNSEDLFLMVTDCWWKELSWIVKERNYHFNGFLFSDPKIERHLQCILSSNYLPWNSQINISIYIHTELFLCVCITEIAGRGGYTNTF